jgi:hypothetical protein
MGKREVRHGVRPIVSGQTDHRNVASAQSINDPFVAEIEAMNYPLALDGASESLGRSYRTNASGRAGSHEVSH